ncbi:MAG: coenzyme-B sulfoethylthiotransferase subunit alpha [Methanosarcinales archaeon]
MNFGLDLIKTYNEITPFPRKPTLHIISGTNIVCNSDDLHFFNNIAMQQFWDDIRRTCIVGLDLIHETLEKRFGKATSPETINSYLEVLNHAMKGNAVLQESMAKIDQNLVRDGYVKIFTGDDELASEIDKKFLIDINKEFDEVKAAQIKSAIGKTTWHAIHLPTIVGRVCDGESTCRWTAIQIVMALVSAYRLPPGNAAVAELAYTTKHASLVEMGEMASPRRTRGSNEPVGLSFGYIADIIQADRINPEDPCNAALEVIAGASVLYDQIWLGSYMSGGVGPTGYATPTYTNEILDECLYYGANYAKNKYREWGSAPLTLEVIKDIATNTTLKGLEKYEKYPDILEMHFGGSQRATVLASASGCATAIATGDSQAGISGWYLSMYLHKEAHGRLGYYGYDLQDQCGAANVFSYLGDEGSPLELRGPNYPNYTMDVGHLGGYAGIVAGAHAARHDAYASNPLVKVCFADDLLTFDFTQPRLEFARGALKQFIPSGEDISWIPKSYKDLDLYQIQPKICFHF